MSGIELTIPIEEVEANGRASSDRRGMMRRHERGEANMSTEESMIGKREAQNGETVNTRNERGTDQSIINDTSTTPMRPTNKDLRTRKAGETIQDH